MKTAAHTTTVTINENSYQIDRFTTSSIVSENWIAFKLDQLYSYRPSTGYWINVETDRGTTHYTTDGRTLCVHALNTPAS
jgi:hypothetical protein